MNLPQARTTDILEQEAGGELLIYDLRTDKAYNLNETLKIVYRACNGQTSVGELKRKHAFTDDLIYLALDGLEASGLLEGYHSDHFAGMDRREVVKRVGLASMIVLPVISSLVAPSAANAASPSSLTCTGTRPGGSRVSNVGNGGSDSAASADCLRQLNCHCVSGNANGSIGFCAGAPASRACTCSGTCA